MTETCLVNFKTSTKRARSDSSLSSASVPEYMSAGQILPDDGLHSCVDGQATGVSNNDCVAQELLSEYITVPELVADDEPIVQLTSATNCNQGCGESCAGDCECKLALCKVGVQIDAVLINKKCCGVQRRMSDDSDKTITRADINEKDTDKREEYEEVDDMEGGGAIVSEPRERSSFLAKLDERVSESDLIVVEAFPLFGMLRISPINCSQS